MPAEPPRDTIHVTQHLLLDGLRILRAQLPAETAGADAIAGRRSPLSETSPSARAFAITE